ncbi:hypothetical protein, partial [Micrococcus luteus]|uniref:hypothetical protein n=1 Tax=Micrococcus luteus TaxID=1270 RepID=UPI0020118C7B
SGAVDPVIIGLLCGAVGLFTGVASMLAFRASERSRTVDLTVGPGRTAGPLVRRRRWRRMGHPVLQRAPVLILH